MEVVRKKGVTGFRIVGHNKKVFYAIIVIIIILLGIVIYLALNNGKSNETINNSETCVVDSDCVPASCCHVSFCVNRENLPKCEGIICTQECKNGTLDCGQASCGCVQAKCSVVTGENDKRKAY